MPDQELDQRSPHVDQAVRTTDGVVVLINEDGKPWKKPHESMPVFLREDQDDPMTDHEWRRECAKLTTVEAVLEYIEAHTSEVTEYRQSNNLDYVDYENERKHTFTQYRGIANPFVNLGDDALRSLLTRAVRESWGGLPIMSLLETEKARRSIPTEPYAFVSDEDLLHIHPSALTPSQLIDLMRELRKRGLQS